VPAGFKNWNQVWAYQARLDVGAERILAAGDAGNASIVADPTKHELGVYWHGRVPAAVRSTASRVGVPVTFRPAAFTHRKLVTEAKRVAGTGRVVSAAPMANGSGLAVTVEGALRPAARSSLRARSRVPLFITRGTRARAIASRQADTPLFWGGSRFFSDVGRCSNGIPVKVANFFSYMMTAAHCVPAGGDGTPVTIPGQPARAGSFSNVSRCRDTALIFYPAGIQSRIYTGAPDAATSAQIGGVTPDFVGNLVVTGGSSSGEHFTIKVSKTDSFDWLSGLSCDPTGPLTIASSVAGTCAAAPGDSGGPVYSYQADGTVLVRGTITAANSNVACPGASPMGGDKVWYAPLARPRGDPQIGSLSFYNAAVLGVPAIDLNGTWTDGRGPGPVISVQGQAITVDMSRFHRPTAHGTFIDETHISVTFPDDRTYTGQLVLPDEIVWSNGSAWQKL
jgi:hypothetical protein